MFEILKNLRFPRIVKTYTILVYLKGGQVLKLKRMREFTLHKSAGTVTGIEWQHLPELGGNFIIRIDVEQITAVIQKSWRPTLCWFEIK